MTRQVSSVNFSASTRPWTMGHLDTSLVRSARVKEKLESKSLTQARRTSITMSMFPVPHTHSHRAVSVAHVYEVGHRPGAPTLLKPLFARSSDAASGTHRAAALWVSGAVVGASQRLGLAFTSGCGQQHSTHGTTGGKWTRRLQGRAAQREHRCLIAGLKTRSHSNAEFRQQQQTCAMGETVCKGTGFSDDACKRSQKVALVQPGKLIRRNRWLRRLRRAFQDVVKLVHRQVVATTCSSTITRISPKHGCLLVQERLEVICARHSA